jgi:hypothetical protein
MNSPVIDLVLIWHPLSSSVIGSLRVYHITMRGVYQDASLQSTSPDHQPAREPLL